LSPGRALVATRVGYQHGMRHLVALAIASIALVPANAGADGHHGRRPLTLAVIGDMPYGTSPTDTTQFDTSPAFIDAINADRAVSFVLHSTLPLEYLHLTIGPAGDPPPDAETFGPFRWDRVIP
jgi:hypothetical protein